MTFATIDEYGFHKGSIAQAAVVPANLHIVVEEHPPTDELAPLHRWKWSGTAWFQAPDHRGHTWYDPANIGPDFEAVAPGDSPPLGWVYWAPGQNKQLNADATLRAARKNKWAEIKKARDAAEFGGFIWDGSPFDSDPKSQSRIQGAGQIAQLDPDASLEWTLQNNDVRTLNAAEIIQVGRTMGMHITGAHARGRVLRAQIDAATTVEAINLITWSETT